MDKKLEIEIDIDESLNGNSTPIIECGPGKDVLNLLIDALKAKGIMYEYIDVHNMTKADIEAAKYMVFHPRFNEGLDGKSIIDTSYIDKAKNKVGTDGIIILDGLKFETNEISMCFEEYHMIMLTDNNNDMNPEYTGTVSI